MNHGFESFELFPRAITFASSFTCSIMLADSPDTTALFFNTSFELSQPKRSVIEFDQTNHAAKFQEKWAREWIKQPMGIEQIKREELGLICTFLLNILVSHESTRQTLRNFNAKIISTLLDDDDEKYDLYVISQLLELGALKLDDGGRGSYVGLIDHLVQKVMTDDDILILLKCLANLSKNDELKNMIKKHAKINKLYKKLTNMLKHEVTSIYS